MRPARGVPQASAEGFAYRQHTEPLQSDADGMQSRVKSGGIFLGARAVRPQRRQDHKRLEEAVARWCLAGMRVVDQQCDV